MLAKIREERSTVQLSVMHPFEQHVGQTLGHIECVNFLFIPSTVTSNT